MHLKLLLFYSNHNCDDNVKVIPSAMGTRQGDLLGRVLFALTYLIALRSIVNHFPLVYFHPLQMTFTLAAPLPFYLLHMSIFRLNFMR
jgi:hypothetical protein